MTTQITAERQQVGSLFNRLRVLHSTGYELVIRARNLCGYSWFQKRDLCGYSLFSLKPSSPKREHETQAVFAQAALPPGQPAADKRGERESERESG